MSLNTEILRSSFELVIDRAPNLTTRFYEILFTRYPQVQPLFRDNGAGTQAQMLAAALASVIDHLEDASWLAGTLRGLGLKHVGYGVTPEMYPWVGECLLAALAEAAGPEWTPALEQAWSDAFEAIASLMLSGAAPVAIAEAS